MAATTIKTGHMEDDAGMIISVLSPYPPFKQGIGIHAQEYVEGTDYAAGNEVVFEFRAITTIKTAIITNEAGVIQSYNEAALTGGGRKLTVESVTEAKLKLFVVTDT